MTFHNFSCILLSEHLPGKDNVLKNGWNVKFDPISSTSPTCLRMRSALERNKENNDFAPGSYTLYIHFTFRISLVLVNDEGIDYSGTLLIKHDIITL